MPISQAPWMGSLTLTTANTNYNLRTLLDGVAPPDNPRTTSGQPLRAQFLAIQLDIDAGGARLYIGNSSLSATFRGVEILANQVWPIYSMDSNLIVLDNINLRCNQDGKVVNICFITR